VQHIATHCNALQHTAPHCNTLQHTTTHNNTLHHTATHRQADRARGRAVDALVRALHTCTACLCTYVGTESERVYRCGTRDTIHMARIVHIPLVSVYVCGYTMRESMSRVAHAPPCMRLTWPISLRLLKVIRHFCRISSLFCCCLAKETFASYMVTRVAHRTYKPPCDWPAGRCVWGGIEQERVFHVWHT